MLEKMLFWNDHQACHPHNVRVLSPLVGLAGLRAPDIVRMQACEIFGSLMDLLLDKQCSQVVYGLLPKYPCSNYQN